MRPGGRARWEAVLAAVMLLAFFAQTFFASRIKSPVFDEPVHIAAGLSYLRTGQFQVNLQHPPLLKQIGAVPLVLRGVRWPVTSDSVAALRGDPGPQWRVGNAIILENDPEKVMLWARLPFTLLATLLGLLIYAWGRLMLDGTSALGALLLYTLDPTIVAHASLVTTDVGFAAFTMLFLFTLWLYLKRRSLGRLLGCGLALGAALASKFSALFLLPTAAVLVFSAAYWVPASGPTRSSSLSDPYASGRAGPRILWCLGMLLVMGLVAALVVEGLYFFQDPFLYVRGLELVNQDHHPGYKFFMAGQFEQRFASYYIVAYLLKEPVASLILVATGLAVMARRGAASGVDRLFLLLPPVALFAAFTVYSDNLGIRYIIPALPFLYLVGGAGLAFLVRKAGAWRRTLAATLGAWVMVAAIGIYPDHLSYFNETACLLKDPARIGWDGGSGCGPLWLDDSNVDWGQGLKQLRAWLDQHGKGRAIGLDYFGTFPPESYGISHRSFDVRDLMRSQPPPAGIYVLSAHTVARAIGLLKDRPDGPDSWLLRTQPTAVVGHAFYVYDVAPG